VDDTTEVRGETIHSQVTVNAQDTCTYVASLDPTEFVETMLYMRVAPTDASSNASDPIHQVADLSSAHPQVSASIGMLVIALLAIIHLT
jgi:hypothetical protein